MRALTPDDLQGVLGVYVSNPDYLRLTEGSAGEPGRYDIGMLQRDVAVAQATPGRHLQGVYTRDGEPVGVLDWLEENPADGNPWIGLLIVHARRQREGIAAEVLELLCSRLRALGASSVRAAVIARNEAGLAFARFASFEPVSATLRRMASEEEVVVMERSLRGTTARRGGGGSSR